MNQFQRPDRLTFKVSQKIDLGFNIIQIRFETNKTLDFTPGQFVTLFMDERTRRSYSISSIPGTNYFETYNDVTPGGPGSLFFKNSKVGDEIVGMFPLGRFVYKEKPTPAVFLATGTGITPHKSMIDFALSNNSQREITLVWGARTDEELFLANNFDELANNYPNFKNIYCITRKEDTKFYKGRVTKYCEETDFNPESEFYICGGQNMIKDVETILLEKGFSKEVIKYEQFY